MILAYAVENGRIVASGAQTDVAAWIDMVEPTEEERHAIGALIGTDIPKRDEMEEIEVSSRLYRDGEADVMTVFLPAGAFTEDYELSPVAFILTPGRLVTVRHATPRPFETYAQRAHKTAFGCSNPHEILAGLIDEIIDRLADILERAGRDLSALSRVLFAATEQAPGTGYSGALRTIGAAGDLVQDVRTALMTLDLALTFLTQVGSAANWDKPGRKAVSILQGDVRSLSAHADAMSSKLSQVLDATLGLISIEQNATMQIFSVVAVVFMPATLIASIFGMNFAHIPLLQTRWGFWGAILAILASSGASWLYFRRRGWIR